MISPYLCRIFYNFHNYTNNLNHWIKTSNSFRFVTYDYTSGAVYAVQSSGRFMINCAIAFRAGPGQVLLTIFRKHSETAGMHKEAYSRAPSSSQSAFSRRKSSGVFLSNETFHHGLNIYTMSRIFFDGGSGVWLANMFIISSFSCDIADSKGVVS